MTVERAIRELVKALREEFAREQGIDPGHEDLVERPSPPACRDGGYVYFIRCDDLLGAIKIGTTSDVVERLKSMRVASPYPLRLVAYFWTLHPIAVEQKLHATHRADRIRGEWFAPSPGIISAVKCCRSMPKRQPQSPREFKDDPYAGIVGDP